MQILSDIQCFAGRQIQARHASVVCRCDMTFSVYLPPLAEFQKVPVLVWLSGLTCTDQNFVIKAGAQQFAARYGVAIVCPDTSPRGEGVPDDTEGAFDLGLGAGFYVNATQQPWTRHYQMADYVSEELPLVIARDFSVDVTRSSIFGHSMGGHGALILALKYPQNYRSVSAFAPIVAPMQVPWGQKAFTAYLGDDRDRWAEYDSVELIKQTNPSLPILIDQGEADSFLKEQLQPELLQMAADRAGVSITLRRQSGYDHSYFFIASFIGEHVAFHAEHLGGKKQ